MIGVTQIHVNTVLCRSIPGFREIGISDNGSLGGGKVDGLDTDGKSLLQVLQDVAAGAFRSCVIKQLFERLQLNQDYHVF